MQTGFIGNGCMAIIIGSVFYNLKNETAALYSRGALLFFAILMAAFQSSLEVISKTRNHITQDTEDFLDFDSLCSTLDRGEACEVRFLSSIRRGHRYVLYYCSASCGTFVNIVSASMICDMPKKIGTATVFNLALYFMANLRRTPGHFFIFYLFTFMCTLTISMYFRSIRALSPTLSQVRICS
jgi:ATP-binding cassette subfamily G (WHITE) protein 2 (PDR)